MPLQAPAANGSECCKELFWTSELLTGLLQMEIDVTRTFETHWRLAGSADRHPINADICVVFGGGGNQHFPRLTPVEMNRQREQSVHSLCVELLVHMLIAERIDTQLRRI